VPVVTVKQLQQAFFCLIKRTVFLDGFMFEIYKKLCYKHKNIKITNKNYSLLYKLNGYLNRVTPYTFVSQRQLKLSATPSPT